jgi:hypothetical protein
VHFFDRQELADLFETDLHETPFDGGDQVLVAIVVVVCKGRASVMVQAVE